MFRVSVERDGREPWARLLVDDVVQIGSARGLELVLDASDVLPLHARLSTRDGCLVLESRPDSDEPYSLAPGDRVAIGPYTLRAELVEDDVGWRLLASLHTDPASRPIYADWLEARGELVHAEYVRALDGEDDAPRRDQLRELALVLPRAWRSRVAPAPIARCDRMLCPLEWTALEPRGPGSRRCPTCAVDVPACRTVVEARRRGGPVWIDRALAGELDAPPLRVDACTGCGHRDPVGVDLFCLRCRTDLRLPRTPPRDAAVRRIPSCCERPWLLPDGRWLPARGSRVVRCRNAWCGRLAVVTAISASLDDHERITPAGADARFTPTGFVWSVEPGRSIGPLVLGMSATELATAWAAIPRGCRTVDDMTYPDVTTSFDADGRCTSIAIALDQPVPVMLAGHELRGVDRAAAEALGLDDEQGITLDKWEDSDSFFMFVTVTSPTHFARRSSR